MTITNQPVALRGANLAAGYAIASVVLLVLNTLAFRVFSVGRGEAISAGFELAWLAAAVVLAVGVIFIGTAIDRPGLAWALVGLIAMTSLLSLGFTLARTFAPDSYRLWSLFSVPSNLFGLAERVVFVVLFVQLCGPKHPWALMVGLVAGGLGVLRTIISFALPFVISNFGGEGMMTWYPWVLGVMGLFTTAATLVLVLGARAHIATSSSEAAAPRPVTEEAPASPAADFGIGAVMLVVGIGVSVASYAVASSGSGGGRYLIATGFIGVGLGRLIRGLIRLSKAQP